MHTEVIRENGMIFTIYFEAHEKIKWMDVQIDLQTDIYEKASIIKWQNLGDRFLIKKKTT